MRASAELIPTVPDDVQLLPITQIATAWHVCERSAKRILKAEGVPIVALGPLSVGARSDVREVMLRRERGGKGCREVFEPGRSR